jgi:CheY-like chemotaxis protein
MKILLVDDDSEIRRYFKMALEGAGFHVTEAQDGLSAIATLQNLHFDAIVLDLSMPRVDGVAALDTFKIMRNGVRVPVITATAFGDEAIEQRALESGAAAFLRKPVPADVLVETVQRCITESREAHAQNADDASTQQNADV